MGQAILKGLIDSNFDKNQILAVTRTPESAQKIATKFGIKTSTNIEEIKDSTVIILGIKPQSMDEVLPLIGKNINETALIISLAVGVTSAKILQKIGNLKNPIVRAMPNTPSLVGKGVTGLAKSGSAQDKDLAVAKTIMESVGEVVIVEEKLIDVIAATSGSGPAYYFYVTECLIDAAIKLGLDKQTAKIIVENTFMGSSALFESENESIEELRKKVTSPKGTTQAAIEFLEENDLKNIWLQALTKAVKRAEEISKN